MYQEGYWVPYIFVLTFPTALLGNHNYYTHFMAEKSQAQRGEKLAQDYKTSSPISKYTLLNTTVYVRFVVTYKWDVCGLYNV